MAPTATSEKDIAFLDIIARAEAAYAMIPEISIRGYFESGFYSQDREEQRSILLEAAEAVRENDRALSEILDSFTVELRDHFFGRDAQDIEPGFKSVLEATMKLAQEGKDRYDFAGIARDYARLATLASAAYQSGWTDYGLIV